MAIAFDAATEIAAGSVASPVTGTHTPVGTPAGVEVVIMYATGVDTDLDLVTGVTYGGVPLTRVDIAQDTTQESGGVVQYARGEGIPSGAQTVEVTRIGGDATPVHVVCRTMTATGDIEVVSSNKITNSTPNPAVVVPTTGRFCLVMGGLYNGIGTTASLTDGAGMTRDHDHDFGASTSYAHHQTTPSTSDFTYGVTVIQGATAMLATAFSEVATDTTRFYMLADFPFDEDSNFTPPFDVPFNTDWDRTAASSIGSDPIRGLALRSKTGISQASALSYASPDGDSEMWAYAQFVSEAFDVAQTISGDFNMALRCQQAAPDVNSFVAYVLRVIKPDGTDRGILKDLSSSVHAVETPLDSDFVEGFPVRAFTGVTLTPVSAQPGDRLVLEIGYSFVNPVTDVAAIALQTDEATQDAILADNDVNDFDPWFEIEQDISFSAAGSAWGFGSPVATLSPFATGDVATTTPVNASGSPVATLSATAAGTVFTEPHQVASGAPVGSLSAFADGEAVMTPPPSITASGAPVASLDSYAQGLAQNPNGPPTPRPKAKGGGAMRVISFEDPPEPKKPEPRPKKVKPTPDAAELKSKDVVLPEIGIKGLAPETLQAFKQRLQIRLPDPKMPAPEVKDKRSVEDRLLENFLRTIGAEQLPNDDNAPFLLQRFLRMGKGE